MGICWGKMEPKYFSVLMRAPGKITKKLDTLFFVKEPGFFVGGLNYRVTI